MKKLYLITGATGHLGSALILQILSKYSKSKYTRSEDSSSEYLRPKDDMSNQVLSLYDGLNLLTIRTLVLPSQIKNNQFVNQLLDYNKMFSRATGNNINNTDNTIGTHIQFEIYEGDITDESSVDRFMNIDGYDEVVLIHMAAIISIRSEMNCKLWDINVNGTMTIMDFALARGVHRVIYVSSVHAIPEKSEGEITEVSDFSETYVLGQYAKSKAAASQIVMSRAEKGLNASIVHPSGILGPYDYQGTNHVNITLKDMLNRKLRVGIEGGYNFVDVRDVAAGILACEKRGKRGQCYLLAGKYYTMTEMFNMARRQNNLKEINYIVKHKYIKLLAPIIEKVAILLGKTPYITPYSVYTLKSNSNFSSAKAIDELGYSIRPMSETIKDIFDQELNKKRLYD